MALVGVGRGARGGAGARGAFRARVSAEAGACACFCARQRLSSGTGSSTKVEPMRRDGQMRLHQHDCDCDCVTAHLPITVTVTVHTAGTVQHLLRPAKLQRALAASPFVPATATPRSSPLAVVELGVVHRIRRQHRHQPLHLVPLQPSNSTAKQAGAGAWRPDVSGRAHGHGHNPSRPWPHHDGGLAVCLPACTYACPMRNKQQVHERPPSFAATPLAAWLLTPPPHHTHTHNTLPARPSPALG